PWGWASLRPGLVCRQPQNLTIYLPGRSLLMRYDVVIIGAGLVGQSLAAALAQGNPQLAIALVDPALASAAELPAVLPTEGLDGFDLRVSALT
ncbi:hypothetical protein Q4595_26630, partial [Wenyingzhuangia sp. 1_MG-2023]|nr:hypothetical protein [Wenyingzhuangia sp. 1_MG-2023]